MGKGKGGKGGAAAATDAAATEVSTQYTYYTVVFYNMCVFDWNELCPSTRLWFFFQLCLCITSRRLQSSPRMLRHVKVWTQCGDRCESLIDCFISGALYLYPFFRCIYGRENLFVMRDHREAIFCRILFPFSTFKCSIVAIVTRNFDILWFDAILHKYFHLRILFTATIKWYWKSKNLQWTPERSALLHLCYKLQYNIIYTHTNIF